MSVIAGIRGDGKLQKAVGRMLPHGIWTVRQVTGCSV